MGNNQSETLVNHYTNYSNGQVVEYVPSNQEPCKSWLLLPAENLWSVPLRGILYITAMLYIFVGIAIVSDIFMCSIEMITSKKRKILRWDSESKKHVEKEVLIWNETVANLTLMALGSSAPEILLNILETCQHVQDYDPNNPQDSLGTFTIIGSAAFNLLIITAICISSVPSPDAKKVKEFGVFMVTSVWSIFAYIWILIVVVWNSPGEVEIWEAWVTLLYFPLLVMNAYCQDNGWWIKRPKVGGTEPQSGSQMNIRVVNGNVKKHHVFHGPSPQLAALEAERSQSQMNLKATTDERTNDMLVLKDLEAAPEDGRVERSDEEKKQLARASSSRNRFRHAAVRSILGGKKRVNGYKPSSASHPRLMELVDKVRTMQDGSSEVPITEDLRGKFTFAASSYSVLESAGKLEVDVLFHRTIPKSNGALMENGKAAAYEVQEDNSKKEDDSYINSVVSISYETREGTAKYETEFRYTQGVLIFQETEWRKSISIPIINDNQFENNMDFYVILKNPDGGGALGDPSLTRVTIIDDDVPGEFSFDSANYAADLEKGIVTATVLRSNGSDGTVSIQYATMDGTARGGLDTSVADYRATSGTLLFEHGETSKQIEVEVNRKTKDPKNFVLTIRNPSLGAKLGEHSAAVANLALDDISERLANLLAENEEEEEETWLGQIKSAMNVGGDKDEEGNEIPPAKIDYLFHFITFLWKVVFSLIPPRSIWGGWPAFILSLACIGVLTAIVEQLATLFSCVLYFKAAVAGITIVALGTSVPDMFASRTASIHDQYADAAIGNITGSNSVNVFLGLGIPWIISVMYNLATKKGPFRIEQGNLFMSVLLFTGIGTLCIIILIMRRKLFGGELGGPKITKHLSGAFLAILWLVYVTIMCLKAYTVI
ncbi:sodium/calcium exchanger 2-like isoform X3 [Patiria miniata]|uniref:Calx-beta domain-containing protein n=1 Tax=Patiria miniata TaxID=46514 RepID=A0A914AUU9_PATMI|nr:sodium/calcium exchanger 2-like isoform X3 [Patiria miniata]